MRKVRFTRTLRSSAVASLPHLLAGTHKAHKRHERHQAWDTASSSSHKKQHQLGSASGVTAPKQQQQLLHSHRVACARAHCCTPRRASGIERRIFCVCVRGGSVRTTNELNASSCVTRVICACACGCEERARSSSVIAPSTVDPRQPPSRRLRLRRRTSHRILLPLPSALGRSSAHAIAVIAPQLTALQHTVTKNRAIEEARAHTHTHTPRRASAAHHTQSWIAHERSHASWCTRSGALS